MTINAMMKIKPITTSALILATALLASPLAATAQRHGGGGANPSGSGSLSGYSRPTGVAEADSLKDFHQVLALQGTSQQVAEFQRLIKTTEAAQSALQSFQQPLHEEKGTAESSRRGALDQALENARSETRKFQESFSPAQKSGLKDLAKRLAKADSDLDLQQKRLKQSVGANTASPELASLSEALEKALTDFYNQQLAIGREMSITLSSGQDLAFTLPRVRSTVSIGHRTVPVAISGALSQIAAQGGQRTFKLELVADLSDLQQNISEILRAQLDTAQTCGQRVAIRQASLTPATPASTLKIWLHFERWMCTRTLGQATSNELAEGDGTVEIKLTAAVENPNTLKLTAAFGRIDATGMLAEALRSGSLGEDLRDRVAQSVQSAARAASDFKVTLPPAVQNSAVIQSAKFQDVGAGDLTMVLDGRIEISSEQAEQLASQLNQALSAHGTPPAETPQLTKRPE
jgi:hypothetical protein